MTYPNKTSLRRIGAPTVAMTLAVLAGCATVTTPDPRDPWQSYNRAMFDFNEHVDKAVLKPVATAYRDVVPELVRDGVGNFFGNLSDAWSFVNNVLQAKPEAALNSFWRVAVNTTFGIGGVFDPASEMQIQKNREDFGQTLGYWGVPTGPYLVLPLLGGSTLRDTVALPIDWYGYPLSHINDKPWMYGLTGLGIVDVRARFLDAGELADTAAIDPYTFRREAVLQRRGNRATEDTRADEERYDLDPPPAGTPEPAHPAKPATPRPSNRQRPTPPLAPTSLAPDTTPPVLHRVEVSGLLQPESGDRPALDAPTPAAAAPTPVSPEASARPVAWLAPAAPLEHRAPTW